MTASVTVPDLEWAILATGSIAESFAMSITHAEGARASHVVSRTLGSARAFAERHGIPDATDDLSRALRKAGALYVATPSAHHAGAIRQALEAGVPVLSEKPLTMTAAEARDLCALARKRDVFLMEAMWMRYLPAFRRAQALVASGRIGEVRRVCAEFTIDRPFDPRHRLYAPALGGGALHDLGVYPINLALAFLGTPDQVIANIDRAPTGVDSSSDLEFAYGDGRRAHLTCGFTHDGANLAIVEGTRGSIVLDAPFFASQRLWIARHPAMTVPFGFGRATGPGATFRRLARQVPLPGLSREEVPYEPSGLQFEIEAATRAIRAGRIEEPDMPHERTVAVLDLIEQALAPVER